MKKALPFALICLALLFSVISLFSDGGYPDLKRLEASMENQTKENEELKTYVDDLRRQVYLIQNDDRTLERVAREEIGMARPREEVFVFKSDKGE